MTVICIIPARGGSTGIPMKNLIKLNKKPLLYYSVIASLNSKFVSKTVVSTDDKKIAEYAQSLGAEVVIRPKKISGNMAGLESAIFYTLNHLKKSENYEPDIVVTLQNTSPFRTSQHIDNAISLLKKKSYDSLISGFKSKYLFWKSKGNFVIPINYDPMNRPRRQEMKKYFIENGAIYVTKYSSLKKFNSRVCGKTGLYEMTQPQSLEIDNYYDLFLAEHIIKCKKNES
jgi:CMP-N,N'-diacetyllegionaminic acid synthase